MKTPSLVTENVVRNHLQAFLEHKGLDVILADYADDASFLSDSRTYRGKAEIREFFESFVAALPTQAVQQFSLRSLRCEGNVAHIIWSAGRELPLGTDTFVVHDGKISFQTCAIYMPPTV
jgi:ketosteroid isomerase-like protein